MTYFYGKGGPRGPPSFLREVEYETKKHKVYVSACKARALYATGIFAEYGDKLLTLSTCDNITDDGRLLVIAKRIL